MEHYKSWSNLNKFLHQMLCDSLKGQIHYFLTRYHQVHNSYGRAAIQLNGREIVCFSWIEMYHQERDASTLYEKNPHLSCDDIEAIMKPKWDDACTYCEMDFCRRRSNSAICQSNGSTFRQFYYKDIGDSGWRVGKRTLQQIADEDAYTEYPFWVRQFYHLRLSDLNPTIGGDHENFEDSAFPIVQ
ncbi:MAG: hypothetical protein ACLTDS_04880 [Bianqueaceae bacterium]